MKISFKRPVCFLLALLLVSGLTACGAKSVDPGACTFDEMVTYLTEKGYIEKDAAPVDNTGGEIPFAPFADQAKDYGGLWLMWWDSATPSEAYTNCFQNIAANSGTVVYGGGAAVLPTEAVNGNFAIAFSEDYAKKDAALADFKALSGK